MKRKITVLFFIGLLIGGVSFTVGIVWAEQSGSSPDSGATSYIKQIYDLYISYNQGSDSSGSWGDWGSYWNRIRSNVIDYSQQKFQRWDDWRDGSSTGQYEYSNEEASWTETSSGGTAASVEDDGMTRTLHSNMVMRDERTGLFWSDATTQDMDNEFKWVAGEDAETTTVACNFLAEGDANSYCDNQDPNNNLYEDEDLSAAEFCLNLSLDSDDDDTPETDWRLPTQKELMQAYVNGSANNLPHPNNYFWSASEHYSNESYAWRVTLYVFYGYTYSNIKATDNYVRCVRRN
jgi:hypothetical protein